MRKEYNLSKSRKNPYLDHLKQDNKEHLKKQITIRIDESVIGYFKEMATNTGIPYQSLINLYLKDCAMEQRKLSFINR
ncbi:MAG: BrnA antitoxin family protein [Desulfobacterales bacterium]|nr:BrnA antitoxin family protein [Desulfobacterales bacterium]